MTAPPSLNKKLTLTPLTDQELDAVTIVFHQYETGLREGTIYTKVSFKKIEFSISISQLVYESCHFHLRFIKNGQWK